MTNEEIALKYGFKKGTRNYANMMDVLNNISIFSKVAETSKTIKFKDIKVNQLTMDEFGNDILDIDIGFPLTITTQAHVLLRVTTEVNGKHISISSKLDSMMQIYSDDPDWEDIDIAQYKEFAREASMFREMLLQKLTNLALALKKDRKVLTPLSSDIDTNFTVIDGAGFILEKPTLVYYSKNHPCSFLTIGSFIAYFDEDYTLTHIGISDDKGHYVVNLSNDFDMLGDLQECVLEFSSQYDARDLYSRFSDALDKFLTIT